MAKLRSVMYRSDPRTPSKVTEGVSRHAADFLLFSNLLLTRLQPRRARRWGMCMDLPQLGPVAVLLLKSKKSAACPETPSVTLDVKWAPVKKDMWLPPSHPPDVKVSNSLHFSLFVCFCALVLIHTGKCKTSPEMRLL